MTQECATLTIEVCGTLLPNKGINLPDTELNIPAVTRRDREAIAVAAAAGVDWLALSFVRDAAAAHELRGVIARPWRRSADARQDRTARSRQARGARSSRRSTASWSRAATSASEIALEKVPHVQKHLIRRAAAAGKPVITATDMLDSMRHNPRPTRAEASDVANAVYDGTDAVMLSGETAVGDYPVEALLCMNTILCEAEKHQAEDGPRFLNLPKGELNDHVTHMTCVLAHEVKADAIITPTITGRTARFVARHRPHAAIVAVSSSPAVVRQTGRGLGSAGGAGAVRRYTAATIGCKRRCVPRSSAARCRRARSSWWSPVIPSKAAKQPPRSASCASARRDERASRSPWSVVRGQRQTAQLLSLTTDHRPRTTDS